MKYASVDIRFEGSKFYPSKLKERTQLPIKTLAEHGEISPKGRYKGKPSPYGIGVLEISPTGKQNNIYELIEEYSRRLLNSTNELKECGVDEIIFDIENSKDFPVEISLSKDIVRNLSSLNARVEFHTINDTEDIKNKIERVKEMFPYLNKEELYQNILASFHKHPSIYEADPFYYMIYLLSKNYSPQKLDEGLSKFEDFYNEVVRH